ncbi:MAG: hypothetical protein RDV41_16025, partial [Planctomycetota bacterium]|nr:hypothetical protein [Planctomycetota bacterium]
MGTRLPLSLVVAVLVAAILSCESGAPRSGKSDALKSIDETSLPPVTGRIELTIHELARLQVPQHPDLFCCFFGAPESSQPKVIAWYWRSNNRLMAAYEIRVSLFEPEPAQDGVAFGDVRKNPDKDVATCLTKVTLRDARRDLLLFEGTEQFEIGEGGKKEEARFR